MLSSVSLEGLAARLDDAAQSARAIPQLVEPLSLEDAYRVQALSLERRYARGERRVGLKMGFTSRAKMVQMGLSELIWGRLTDAMLVDDGGVLSRARYVHPRVEPEVAFVLAKPLGGHVSLFEAAAAVGGVAAALEIIDSRYENFKFSLTDVIADNTSAAGFVLGPWCDPSTDVSNVGMLVEIDGKIVQAGSSAAILDRPLRSLVAAARLAGAAGERLEPGDIVMAGAATAAESLAPGSRVRLSVERLGDVGFTVGP